MILERLQDDMKAAMRARDRDRLAVIRMLVAELHNARIAAGKDLDEAAEIRVLAAYAKKRREAAETARAAGRDEHARREAFELEVVESYLPEPLDEARLEAIVARHVEALGASGPSAMGEVMRAVMAEVAGRADGKVVSGIVRRLLSGG